MAAPISSGYLGDATQGIGQGLAFVLPEGKAGEYAMQLAQTHAQQLQDMAKQKVLQQQKLQQQYETDFRNDELPKIWGPFSAGISKMHYDNLASAAGQWAQTDKSPWSDPKFIEKVDKVKSLAETANQFGTQLTTRLAAARSDKDGKYNESDKKALEDYYNKFNAASDSDKMDYILNPDNHKMPDLNDRDYDVHDAVKALKPTGDQNENENQVFSLLGDPKYHSLFHQSGYDTNLPDGSAYQYQKDANGKDIPSTGHRVFPTDDAYAHFTAHDWLTNPFKADKLAAAGVNKDDPDAEEKLAHLITAQNAGAQNIVSTVSPMLFDQEKAQQLTDQRNAQKRDAERLNLTQKEYQLHFQEHKDLQVERKAKFEATPPFDRAAQQMQQAHVAGDDAAVKKYADGLVEHIPNKKYKEPITTDVKNGILTIHVPKEHIPSGNGARAYDIPVGMSDPNFESVLWAKLKGAGMDVDSYNKSHKEDTYGSKDTPGKPKINVDPNIDLTQ